MAGDSRLPWWAGHCGRKLSEPRLSHAVRLERLEIEEQVLEIYEDLFLKDRDYSYFAVQKNGSWATYHKAFEPKKLLLHLAGECNLALAFGQFVDKFVIDLDCKGKRTRDDAIAVARAVLSALPDKPLIYQSSDSGGIRMLWFLRSPVERSQLNAQVKLLLRGKGIIVASGICEVRLDKAADRLPFGRHSFLLDPVTFEPLWHLGLSETLAISQRLRRDFPVAPADLGMVPDCSVSKQNSFLEIIRDLRENGLPRDRSTNDCLKKMAWYNKVLAGMDSAENIQSLMEWLEKQNNGNSDRVNGGKWQNLQAQVTRIVSGIKAERNVRGCKRNGVSGLSQDEALYLLNLRLPYKLSSGLFKVLVRARQYGHFGTTRLSMNSQEGDGTNKWGRDSSQGTSIPNVARNRSCYVALPKKVLRELKVPHSENPCRFVQELEAHGLLCLKRKHWKDRHQAAQFWVNFPLNPSQKGRYRDFEQALVDLLSPEELKKMFPKQQSKRTMNTPTAPQKELDTEYTSDIFIPMEVINMSNSGNVDDASRQIHIRISQETHRKLRIRAAELDTTIQEIVVKAIDSELKKPQARKDER